MPQNSARYSKTIIVIHWLTAEGGREVAQRPPVLHFTLGLAVLALVVPRLILRLAGAAPDRTDQRNWLATAAKVGHGLLYLLLIGWRLPAGTPHRAWGCQSRSSASSFRHSRHLYRGNPA